MGRFLRVKNKRKVLLPLIVNCIYIIVLRFRKYNEHICYLISNRKKEIMMTGTFTSGQVRVTDFLLETSKKRKEYMKQKCSRYWNSGNVGQ